MIFTELRFVFFFFLVFAVHWALRGRRGRQAWLLAASYVFYGAWDPRFLGLIILSTAIDYGVAIALAREGRDRARRALLGLSLAANLGLLGFFKYYGFFAASLADLLGWLGLPGSLPVLEIILPVGISFYTFQTLSYTIDVYRRRLEPERDPLAFALFVAFFPQLVAGPIVRASEFLPLLARRLSLSDVKWRAALWLFLAGYFKKAVVSDNFAPYVDAFFHAPGDFGAATAWLGVILYAAQIYCDFSGYSDMARGAAGLLGYDLPLNFRRPYLATSPREFWQRWHISLSTWLRDYLYIPLGGNRGSRGRTALNLMITMLLGGLWHGAAWGFVLWGGIHGAALAAGALWRKKDERPKRSGAALLAGWALTLLLVLTTWVLFRADSLPAAGRVFAVLLGLGEGTFSLPPILWAAPPLFLAAQWAAERAEGSPPPGARLPWPVYAFLYGVVFAVLFQFVNLNYRPFIYFQF
jgi:alginate O-acetyltransferase complex protein AlgI